MKDADTDADRERAEFDSVVALNEWNRRPEVDRMLCAQPNHGPLFALRDAANPADIRWQCPVCGDRQPISDEQVTIALGTTALPVPSEHPDRQQVTMPADMPGDRGNGTVLLSALPRELQRNTAGRRVSGLAVMGMSVGLLLGFVALGAEMRGAISIGTAGLIAVLLVATLGLVGQLVERRFPVAYVTDSREVPAYQLRPGDWVPDRPGRQVPGLATRVVQVSGLELNHRNHPGVRITLLNGNVVESGKDEAWLVLTLK